MSQHLAFVKWRESAFSTELLKGSRWLVGARPKGLPDSLQEVLTVTPQAQAMLMELHVKRFLQATRRAKPSQRARARASPEEFEKMVDYACVFAHLRENAKKATSDPKVDGKLKDAFLAKHLVLSTHCVFVCTVLLIPSRHSSFCVRLVTFLHYVN